MTLSWLDAEAMASVPLRTARYMTIGLGVAWPFMTGSVTSDF